MRVVKEERLMTVQVDSEDPIEEAIARRLDVNATIHVGGLPQAVVPREGLVSCHDLLAVLPSYLFFFYIYSP